jgi:hypothetical protein
MILVGDSIHAIYDLSMNRTSFVFISLFISALCHLAVFMNFILVFPIVADGPKPKFFFLGPILKQIDIEKLSIPPQNMIAQEHGVSRSNELSYVESNDQDSPFAVKTIRKPLLTQIPKTADKVIIKSTFDMWPIRQADIKGEEKPLNADITVQPYRPLHFRSP